MPYNPVQIASNPLDSQIVFTDAVSANWCHTFSQYTPTVYYAQFAIYLKLEVGCHDIIIYVCIVLTPLVLNIPVYDINTMAADALALYVARSSAALARNM